MHETHAITATLDDLDDPIRSTSDRAPLTGNISSSQANQNARTANNTQGYLNSVVAGEDRRAALSTIDESVWDTLKRDLLAVWEKMRQVLYPKYLLGGMIAPGGGIGGAERGEGDGLAGGAGALGNLRGLVGRWPDADVVLQGGMSEGLRNWDLWYGSGMDMFENCLLTDEQGSIAFLPTAVLPAKLQRKRRPALNSIQWSLRDNLDRRGSCHHANQVVRREYVSTFYKRSLDRHR
jgi:hypothetical protein